MPRTQSMPSVVLRFLSTLFLGGLALYLLCAVLPIPTRLPFISLWIMGISLWEGVPALLLNLIIVAVFLGLQVNSGESLLSWTTPVAGGLLLFGVLIQRLRQRTINAETAAHTSEEKYRQLVDKSLAGIFVYRDDRIVYANSRFKDIVGHRPEDVIGKTFWEFVCEDDRPKIREFIARRATGHSEDLHYECRLQASDGRTAWVEVVSSPVEFEGDPAVLVCAYNITARKRIEEQQKELSTLARKQEEQLVHSTRLAEMGEMAAGVAHELNQPLTGIKNFARNAAFMLDEDDVDLAQVRENLHLISSQVDRASRIINQMRELTRRSERHLGPVDINNTLRESVEFVMPQLKLSGVDVALFLAPDLPSVIGDRIRLEQVFLNLLTNARHAMEEMPERRLEIRTCFDPQSTYPVVIDVIDTGKGFAPDVADKLFTPFFSTKTANHGTGLGLSISHTIVKDHHGEIEAKGTEGQGATFTVRLPIQQKGIISREEKGNRGRT